MKKEKIKHPIYCHFDSFLCQDKLREKSHNGVQKYYGGFLIPIAIGIRNDNTSKYLIRIFYCSIVLLFYCSFLPDLSGQNICISSSGARADTSAELDIVAADKGLLIPRVALTGTADAATIATPATSLIVYNTGAGGLSPAGYYYNSGTSAVPFWVPLLNAAVTPGAISWQTLGNAGTLWNTHFLGTTDNVSLRLRTNNIQRMIIDSVGNVGIATTAAPLNALSIGPSGGTICIGTEFTNVNSDLMMMGPVLTVAQGGSPIDVGDVIWIGMGGNDYRAYISNGMRLDGDVLVESGKVGRGISPTALLHITTNTTALGLSIYEKAGGDIDSYDINFRKARNTVAAPAIISAADELGVINFSGYSGAGGNVTGAAIKAISESTIAATRVPAHLSFWTGNDATPTVLTERMRITKAGNVGIATTSPASTLAVNGSIAGKYRAGNTIAMTNTDFFINLTGAGGATLPAASTVAAGTIVIICNTTAADIALNRSGSDTMCNVAVVAGCSKTTVTVPANNGVVRYFSDGASVWTGW